MTSAFTAPHVTVFHTVDVTKTMKLRRPPAARTASSRDVRVTPLLIAAKALMLAVAAAPGRSTRAGTSAAQEIVYKHYVNLGIAAATPRGLVVPNMKDAHRLDLKGLADALAELTATARAGRTTPADMPDGTITITNVGVFGIDTGTPILNPGEAAILAFGAIREQPWVHKGRSGPPRHAAGAELRPPAGRRRAGLAGARGRRRADRGAGAGAGLLIPGVITGGLNARTHSCDNADDSGAKRFRRRRIIRM